MIFIETAYDLGMADALDGLGYANPYDPCEQEAAYASYDTGFETYYEEDAA